MPAPQSFAPSDRLNQLEASVREQARKLYHLSQDLQSIAEVTQSEHHPMIGAADLPAARQPAPRAFNGLPS